MCLTPNGRWGQGPGSVDPRFPAGLPFPVPEIIEFVALSRDSGNIFQPIFPEFSRNFPAELLHRPQKQPQPSRVSDWWTFRIFLIFSCSGEGEGGVRGAGKGGGAIFLWKIPGGRGSFGWVGAGGEGPGGCLRGTWGGG